MRAERCSLLHPSLVGRDDDAKGGVVVGGYPCSTRFRICAMRDLPPPGALRAPTSPQGGGMPSSIVEEPHPAIPA